MDAAGAGVPGSGAADIGVPGDASLPGAGTDTAAGGGAPGSAAGWAGAAIGATDKPAVPGGGTGTPVCAIAVTTPKQISAKDFMYFDYT